MLCTRIIFWQASYVIQYRWICLNNQIARNNQILIVPSLQGLALTSLLLTWEQERGKWVGLQTHMPTLWVCFICWHFLHRISLSKYCNSYLSNFYYSASQELIVYVTIYIWNYDNLFLRLLFCLNMS